MARARGYDPVSTLTAMDIEGIDVADGQVTGVRTSAGDIATETVVDAAGPYAGDVAAMANLGIRRLEESRGFMRALGPVLRHISGEPVEDGRGILERLFRH